MEEAVVLNKGEDLLDLPPGFRFHPTDEEIITFYLAEKVVNSAFAACAIGEVDLNKSEPWDLPKKAKMGEKEWYFFCQRDRKYPTGMRTNRATDAGYWKATGKDKEIFNKSKNCLVGMKKTLVFYRGRAPKGEKTNWVMHEYRLEGKFSYYNLPKSARDEWVVCRVFHKSTGIKKSSIHELLRVNSFGDDFLDYSSLPPLMDPPSSAGPGSSSFNEVGNSDFKAMTSRPLDGNDYSSQFLTSMFNNNNQNYHHQPSNPIYTQQPSSILYQQIPNFTFQAASNLSATTTAYLQASSFCLNDQTIDLKGKENQCKVEQFSSNQSVATVSQDTGISTDMNTAAEISSVLSTQEIGSRSKVYGDLDHQGPSSTVADLESLWNY